MTITKMLVTLLALGTVGLAGCSYAGAEADREAAAQPAAQQTAQEQPAEQPAPAPTPPATAAEPTAAPAPSDGGDEAPLPTDGGETVAQPSGGGAEPAPTGIPLVDTSEGTVTYLRAIQNFSPRSSRGRSRRASCTTSPTPASARSTSRRTRAWAMPGTAA